MKDRNYSSQCEFAEGIVAYMYGEMPAEEQDVFESHIEECQTCIDEFAVVSEARFSVYEWQRSEFAPLETPTIRVPIEKASAAGTSWLQKFGNILFPVPAFAALAIVVGLALGFILLRSAEQKSPPTLAENGQITGSNTTPERVDARDDAPPVEPVASNKGGEQIRVGESKEYTERGKAERPRARIVRTETAYRPQRIAIAKTVPPMHTEASTAKPAKGKTVPRMNDFSDEEDNSLRLAELFDDVETLY